MYVEEPWKGSVPKVHHKRTTDGSDLRVMDPNRPALLRVKCSQSRRRRRAISCQETQGQESDM